MVRILDAHTHIFPPEIATSRHEYLGRDNWFGTLYASTRAKIATAEDLIAAMDRDGVESSVACGFGWREPALCRLHNDYLLDAAQRYPGRILPFIGVQPSSPAEAVAEARRCAALGARGLGELMPDGQGFSLRDAELLGPLVRAALDAGLPVLTHSSEPVGHLYPGKGTVTPDTLVHFARAFPDLTIVCAHWGGGLFAYELMPEIASALGNVYYDTAATPYLYGPRVYRTAIAAIGADKILFGSDFPLLRQRRCLDHLTENTEDSVAVERILGGNARRILRLED